MFRRADPVGVDGLDGTRVGLALPAQEKLLGQRLAPLDDVLRDLVAMAVGDARRSGGDRAHLRGQASEVLTSLLVGDLVQLAEVPDPLQPRDMRLEVGRCVPGQPDGVVRLGLGRSRR